MSFTLSGLSATQLLAVLVGLLPAITAWAGSTAAGLIRQDGLPPVVNSAISVVLVGFFAALNVLVSGKLTNNYSTDFAQASVQATVLLAGGLHLLTPYVTTLQSNFLAVLQPKSVAPLPDAQPTVPRLSVITGGGRTSQAQAPGNDNIGG